MYEAMTYEVILQRMLDRVSDQMDKREGSIIFDALAPAAIELQAMYIAFDCMMDESYGDTASREFLVRLCKDRGITPYKATAAILQMNISPSTIDCPMGERFNCANGSYVITSKNADGTYKVQCELFGEIGNQYIGDVLPINYVQGLERAVLTSILIYGENEENTEALRKRYYNSFEAKAFSGNKADYKEKALALAGVGAVKVTPIWNGGGTVKVTILDSAFGKGTDTLIQSIQKEFDPHKNGMGDGLAGIGHTVTVDTATEVVINVTTAVTYENGYDKQAVQISVEQAISDYLLDLRKTWDENDSQMVRIAQIDAKLMAVHGILDISGTTINTSTGNFTLTKYQIPTLGVVAFG